MLFLLCYINKKLSIFINNNNVWIKINYIFNRQRKVQNVGLFYTFHLAGEEINDIAKIYLLQLLNHFFFLILGVFFIRRYIINI